MVKKHPRSMRGVSLLETVIALAVVTIGLFIFGQSTKTTIIAHRKNLEESQRANIRNYVLQNVDCQKSYFSSLHARFPVGSFPKTWDVWGSPISEGEDSSLVIADEFNLRMRMADSRRAAAYAELRKVGTTEWKDLFNGVPMTCACAFKAGAGNFAKSDSAGTYKGRMIVSHDVNIFSVSRAGPNESAFAVNVARWLTGDKPGKILFYESKPGDTARNLAPGVASALTAAGYPVTRTSPTTASAVAADLVGYSAVYIGTRELAHSSHLFPFADPTVLVDFIKNGGGVYVYGGVADVHVQHVDSTLVNPLLAPFGLAIRNVDNDIYGHPTDGSHPIFDCIPHLNTANGHSIRVLTPSPATTPLLSAEAGAYYFVAFDGPLAP